MKVQNIIGAITYLFALLSLHLFPKSLTSRQSSILFQGLEKSLESLLLFQPSPHSKVEQDRVYRLSLELSFLLEKPGHILEMMQHRLEQTHHLELFLANSFFALLHLKNEFELNQALEWIEKINSH